MWVNSNSTRWVQSHFLQEDASARGAGKLLRIIDGSTNFLWNQEAQPVSFHLCVESSEKMLGFEEIRSIGEVGRLAGPPIGWSLGQSVSQSVSQSVMFVKQWSFFSQLTNFFLHSGGCTKTRPGRSQFRRRQKARQRRSGTFETLPWGAHTIYET